MANATASIASRELRPDPWASAFQAGDPPTSPAATVQLAETAVPPVTTMATPAARSPFLEPSSTTAGVPRTPFPVPPGPSDITYVDGADRPPSGRLVLIGRDGGEGPNFGLRESLDIGRIEGVVILADDRYVSPRHARIVARRGSYHLRDLDSTNGVFLRIPFLRGNADPSISRKPLDPEQELGGQELFLLGQQVLRFEIVKNAEEGLGVASENGTLLFGTPATPRFARISQRTVEGVIRDVFHVRKAETVIGRESGDIVFSDDPFVSRRHAVIRVLPTQGGSGRRFTLADLSSSNGTFLQIREEVQLRHGDHIRIGQQLLRFDLDTTSPGA